MEDSAVAFPCVVVHIAVASAAVELAVVAAFEELVASSVVAAFVAAASVVAVVDNSDSFQIVAASVVTFRAAFAVKLSAETSWEAAAFVADPSVTLASAVVPSAVPGNTLGFPSKAAASVVVPTVALADILGFPSEEVAASAADS